MSEAGERPAACAVAELELELDDAIACANRIDRHAELHPETRREGQHVCEDTSMHRPLPGDRRLRAQTAAPADSPAREADRQPEPSARRRREGPYGQVG
jgi:hypothetical protein